VDLLQKKIQNLEQDNRKLHAEASKVGTGTVFFVLKKLEDNLKILFNSK
jgi:hypothetical protein